MTELQTYEDFLKLFYGGQIGFDGMIKKGDDPYALARTDFFDPMYSAKIEAWAVRADTLYRLLPKTTYMEKGDSLKFIATDPYVYATTSALRALAETTPLFTSVDTDMPDVTDFDYIEPAYVDLPWHVTMQGMLKAGWTRKPNMTPELLRAYNMERFVHLLDEDLCLTCDSYSASRITLDSIDMIIANKANEDLSGVDVGDCDLWHTQTAVDVDRSATTYDAQVDLPATEVNRTLTLDMIDNIMATAKKYGSGNYIAFTNDDTVNALQKLIDPKGRYLHGEKEVEITANGVSTRKGVGAGRLPVSTILTNGLTIPVFTDPNCAVPVSGGAGNLYFIDLEHIELRVALPISYFHTDFGQHFLLTDTPDVKHDIFFGAQLIADKFNCHAGIKYIAKAT